MSKYAEYEIIQGCIAGNLQHQRMLYDLYAGKMMTVCLRYASSKFEAEDMLQESFIRIFKYIDQFKYNGSLEGWIRRIVVNCCIRCLEQKKIKFVQEEYAADKISTEHDGLESLNEEQILALIKALPEGYKMVFNLYIIEGYSHDEIAQILKITAATSRSQLLKARKMLQSKIIELSKIIIQWTIIVYGIF